MIGIENIEVFGWETAIRGARNPLNSWNRIDSTYSNDKVELGPNDYKLLKNLCQAGTDHRKWMRMVNVTMDITAPLYWWKEFDTYKVGTVANSCSTMHKIQAKEFDITDFSFEHLNQESTIALSNLIDVINKARDSFNSSKDKNWWWQMIQLLPTSYNQKRTVQLNYEVLNSMYHARKNHKLDEWRTFCKAIEIDLPYSEFITGKFKATEIDLPCSEFIPGKFKEE